MGNCVRKGSSTEWGGDDWGSFGSGHDKNGQDEDPLLSSTKTAEGKEVKIKVSKKELERLLKEADVEGLSLQQLLAQLMGAGDGFDAHHRSWRPALNSIPEGNSVSSESHPGSQLMG